MRLLINLYTVNVFRVSWSDVMSAYFKAVNGVKQGLFLSSVLFCLYMNDFLLHLSRSDVGCYLN